MAKNVVETPLMRQYFKIKEQNPDAVLLFRVGDFYETYSDDAVAAAEILGITLTKRANGVAASVEMAGFPHHALDNYLPKLVRAGKRVAICDQLEDPKQTKTLVKRGITELVTPGVTLNDNVLDNKQNNFLAAIKQQKDNTCGFALLDISTGEFLCTEGNRDYIDKLLGSYQPKEVLVERCLRADFDRFFSTKAFIYELDDWYFSQDNNRELLLRHFGVQSLKGFGLEEHPLAATTAGVILNYLELTKHTQIGHITTLGRIDRSGFVRLDKFTVRSLELLQPISDEGGRSLLDIIDHTITPMGARLLRKWIVFPLAKTEPIHRRQSMVAYLFKHPEEREQLCEQFSMVGDLERLCSKAATGRISPREVVQLMVSLDAIEPVRNICLNSDEEALIDMGRDMDVCHTLRERIRREIVPDAPIALGRGTVIATGVDVELDELRQLSSGSKEYLMKMQQRESERTGITSLKIGFNNVFGYYIEVRNTHKEKVPPEWIRKQTLVSAERYITEELKHYEEKILGAEERIAAIENRIFFALIGELTSYIVQLQTNSRTVAQLDCIYALSEAARRYKYVCPAVDDSLSIDIKKGRHPVIEQQLPPEAPYVPNDVFLDNETLQIMMVTGPNMSGKSALLRQTALITLMAQMGGYVPAEAAHIGIVDSIFTRVGASDNISRGESTFMVEMQEASNILNNLTERSLVLFDELGRGTSTYDGISIAWAIVEYLHNNNRGHAKTLFATHYHELNEMEAQLPRVRNFNVSAREVNGRMLFLRKLEPGGSAHSFGIEVARLGGMPPSIVERAKNILKQLEQDHIDSADTPVSNVKDNSKKKKKHTIDGYQLSFFQLDDPLLSQIRDELLEVDINNLTPLEALNKLSDIKKLLKGF
ncbi:DNA mismatch repair protein MutS [Porphyromonas macacae]|uniref:DNA mismatch repair protein MutS n=1 Tax=Porphyromonas macacae TaxID=28115 RepID=UPI0024ADA0B8|nr:DNA mismatch repair protein MutS [Porphyromonas macacae]